jgi:hypothetical protein
MHAAASHDHDHDRKRDLTVAHLRERPGGGCAEVMFLESTRTFRLPSSHKKFELLLIMLLASEVGRRPVRVTLTTPHGDIDDVQCL